MTTATDIVDGRPRRSAELHVGPAMLHGPRTVHLVKDRRSGKFFEIGAKERFIVERLDGSHSLREIGQEYAAEFGRTISDNGWSSILATLWRKGFLDIPGVPSVVPPATEAKRGQGGRKGLTGTLVLGDPQRLLARMHRRLRWAFQPVVAVPVVLGCLVMVGFLAAHAGELWTQSRSLARNPELAVLAVLLIWVSSVLHELGHGLWTHHFGGRATEIGIRWRAPVVTFYCEADDVLVFPRRWHRVATAGVGVVMNLLFLVPFVVLWLVLPDGDATHDAVAGLLLFGALRALLNYLPVPRLDGYLMVGHAFAVVDLGPQTWIFLRRWLGGFGREYPAAAKRIYLGYTVAFTASVFGVVAAAVSVVGVVLTGAARWGVLGVMCVAAVASMAGGMLKRRAAVTGESTDPSGCTVTAEVTPVSHPTGIILTDVSTRMSAEHFPMERRSREVNTGASPEPALVAHEIRKKYGNVEAVAGTSFSVDKGEFFGILGPNGAGKTTLIEILEGQRKPDSGAVEIFGQSPWPRNLRLYARIGIQTQTSAFFPELTALEHLEAIAGLYQLPRQQAARTLELVKLTDSARVRVAKLSGGQRQRLAIASALVHKPQLLFLDEPTAALDPQARRDFWELLRKIQADGCSIVYTTHHLDEAEALCDRVAIVKAGSMVALDTPRQLISASGGAARICLPQTEALTELAASLVGIGELHVDRDQVEIHTHTPSRVLAALADVVDLGQVDIRQPTLEDVYLNLTGTEYSQ